MAPEEGQTLKDTFALSQSEVDSIGGYGVYMELAEVPWFGLASRVLGKHSHSCAGDSWRKAASWAPAELQGVCHRVFPTTLAEKSPAGKSHSHTVRGKAPEPEMKPLALCPPCLRHVHCSWRGRGWGCSQR
jgi:hypothetical protein